MRRFISVLLLILVLLVPAAGAGAARAPSPAGSKSYVHVGAFGAGTHEGTLVAGGALVLDPAALRPGSDTLGRYNGGAYLYGRYTAPVQAAGFVEAIASWQANTPPGTWIELELRAQVDAVWTKWYSMGVWLEGDAPFRRHSVTGQGDKNGYVAVDTLVLSKAATAVQARVTLFQAGTSATPTLRAFGISFASGDDKAGAAAPAGLVSDLNVPMRSQMVFPDGGEVWCSPTSTSMVMAYWAAAAGNPAWDLPVPTVVNGVWDYTYNGGGNWPFNTAYAASLGLDGRVVRLSSLAEVEEWTAAGVPVIASIAYNKGELTGSPIPSSGGHLLVIRGFTAAGDVITNDPAAAADDAVKITYNRWEFEQAWLGNSNGVVYLIFPQGWAIPASNGKW